MPSKSQRLRGYGRRTFITALMGLGLSRTTAASLDQNRLRELTEDPSKEVPVATAHIHQNHEAMVREEEAPKRKTVFTTIPRDIWERNRAAHNAARRLDERLPRVARVGVSGHGDDPRLIVEYRGAPDEGPGRRSIETQEEPPSAAKVAGTLPETATGSIGRGRQASEHTFDVKFEERRLGFLEPPQPR